MMRIIEFYLDIIIISILHILILIVCFPITFFMKNIIGESHTLNFDHTYSSLIIPYAIHTQLRENYSKSYSPVGAVCIPREMTNLA